MGTEPESSDATARREWMRARMIKGPERRIGEGKKREEKKRGA